MILWQIMLAVALSTTGLLLVLLGVFLYLHGCSSSSSSSDSSAKSSSSIRAAAVHSKATTMPCPKFFPSIDPLKTSSRFASSWRSFFPVKPFLWNDHPSLISDAVEHGWSTFSFSYTSPLPPNFWDLCTGCSLPRQFEPDISWEMGDGSDYLQKIRLNPGLLMKKESSVPPVQTLQTALPLPGPPLGPQSFPQEAYFEITILTEGREYNFDASHSSFTDNEHVKLISKHFLSGKHLSSELTTNYPNELFEIRGEQQSKGSEKGAKAAEKTDNRHIEMGRLAGRSEDQLQAIAVGLAAGGAPPFRLPGCDAGSVGFHSSGRVYLNGALHIEQEPKIPCLKRAWSIVNTTVGCGFDPAAKTVFFTVNGEQVCELTASSAEFGNPLFPTIAANYDVTVLSNFGQSPFEYAPANAHRVPDPCFKRPFSTSLKASVNEDSGDLFSMGRIDSHWLTDIVSPTSEELQHRHMFSEAESDLFEIVLDSRN